MPIYLDCVFFSSYSSNGVSQKMITHDWQNNNLESECWLRHVFISFYFSQDTKRTLIGCRSISVMRPNSPLSRIWSTWTLMFWICSMHWLLEVWQTHVLSILEFVFDKSDFVAWCSALSVKQALKVAVSDSFLLKLIWLFRMEMK